MIRTIFKCVIPALFLHLSFATFAQFSGDSTEILLIQPDKTWYISYKHQFMDESKQIVYHIGKDTLINNTKYHKVYQKPYNKNHKVYFGLVNVNSFDTANEFLRLIKKNDTSHYYFFPVSLYDTVFSCWQVVDIQELQLKNKWTVNVYILENITNRTQSLWIEGIGDLEGIFYSSNKYFDLSCKPSELELVVSGNHTEELLDSVYLNGVLLFERSMLEEIWDR